MKVILLLMGLLVLFLGLLPFLQSVTFLSFLAVIPSSGTVYSILVTAIGVIAIFLGIRT